MKNLCFLFLRTLGSIVTHAQNTFSSSGNLGIGTTSPVAKLTVVGSMGASGGNGDLFVNAENSFMDIDGTYHSRMGFIKKYGYYPAIAGDYQTPIILGHINSINLLGTIATGTLAQQMVITPSGNVGIGIIDPQSKLAVNGNITSKQVKVTQAGWPDYVFDQTYQLPDLNAVKDFVTQHRHLSGIPSAEEIEADGLDLGDMQRKQMQKIEELTLYLVNLNEKIKLLQDEVSQLRSLNTMISKQIKELQSNQ